MFVWKMGLTSNSIAEKQIGCAVGCFKMILEIIPEHPWNLILGCLNRVNSISVEFLKISFLKLFFIFRMSLFGSSSNNNSGDEHVIANPPDDTVSRLRFNPNPQNGQQFICSGSWANDVRIWQIATQQQSSGT